MKKKAILTAIILLGTHFAWASTAKTEESSETLTVQAQKPALKAGISVDPIWLLLSGIGGKFEYFMTDRISVGVSGVYVPEHQIETSSSSKSDSSFPKESYRWSTNEINLGSNIMLTGNLSNNGVYVSPSIGYQNTRISDFGILKLSGSLSSPQARLTAGYQWVNEQNNLRFAAGGGLRLVQSSDIVIKDKYGVEKYRENSSNLGGLALDCHFGYIF